MAPALGLLAVSLLGMTPAMSATSATTPAFDRLVVFGDSLSDNGNAGRFSNGPVWVERLAARLGLALDPARLGGDNFAVGGARLDPRSGPDNLRAQVDLFLRMPRPEGRTLHVVYGGGNDLRAAVGSPAAATIVESAAASLKAILVDLVQHGATELLVPNLPDIGMTPEMRMLGSRAVAEAARLSDRFNAAVDRAVADLAATPGLRLYRLDVHAMADRARADPASFGFRNVTTPCGALNGCEGYLFWDSVHPTTAAHDRLAEAAFRLIRGEPVL